MISLVHRLEKTRIRKIILFTGVTALLVMSLFMTSLPAKAVDQMNLIIIGTSPDSGDTDVAADANIVVTFDSIIDFSSVTSSSFQVSGSESGVISGTFSGEGSDVITFDPDSNFASEETVSVTLTTDIRNTMMMTLNSENYWSFTVESVPVPPLPEASTLAMVGGGLVVLVAWLFFRHRKQSVTTA